MPLEIACFTLASAQTTLRAGADRVEFCSGLEAGGVTPSTEDFVDLCRYRASSSTWNHTPIFVMIRPRGDDFVYSDAEFNQMKTSLAEFRDLGADGFVFGMLQSDGGVDEMRNSELVDLAQGKPCTFHRAFDQAADKRTALDALVRCGFVTLLTSGGEKDVVVGKDVLKNLVEWADGRLIIMPGGGLRSSNLSNMIKNVGATWWHSSAIVEGKEASFDEIGRMKMLVQ